MSNCCASRRSYYSDPGPDVSTVITVLMFIFLIIWGFVGCNRALDKGAGTETYIVATVTDKNVKRTDNDDVYLIYTKTTEGTTAVFEVTDSLLAGRFNSSDVYAEIEIGKTYQFGVRGQRNQLMSWYPNIYDYTEVAD